MLARTQALNCIWMHLSLGAVTFSLAIHRASHSETRVVPGIWRTFLFLGRNNGKSHYYSETKEKLCFFQGQCRWLWAQSHLYPSHYWSPDQMWPRPREHLGFRCLNVTAVISIFSLNSLSITSASDILWNEKLDFSISLKFNWSILKHICVQYSLISFEICI